MSAKHNKKRNGCLVYEFLIRLISSSLIEQSPEAKTALTLLKKYYKPGTELHKEFRLINSLMKISVSNQHVAASIIGEAKIASRQHDIKKLNEEKSSLIRDINRKLDATTFWDQPVSEYKMFATLQTLINDWRFPSEETLNRQAIYEDRLIQWMTEAKTKPEVQEELAGTVGENRLVFKHMMKKLNEKYGESLNTDQKRILREYVFTTITDKSQQVLQTSLLEIKNSILKNVDDYLLKETHNQLMIEKLLDVKKTVISETLDVIDDDTITRFMLYTKLSTEFSSKE